MIYAGESIDAICGAGKCQQSKAMSAAAYCDKLRNIYNIKKSREIQHFRHATVLSTGKNSVASLRQSKSSVRTSGAISRAKVLLLITSCVRPSSSKPSRYPRA